MDDQQELIRARIKRVAEKTGLTYTALARKAGLSATTLTRFMNSPSHAFVLTTRTLGKINQITNFTENYQPVEAPSGEDADQMMEIGRRMKMVRHVMAPSTSDEKIAELIGWTPVQMRDIFAGRRAPSIKTLSVFANRMQVTTDFLLTESLEGLPRLSERRLTAAYPNLGLQPMGTAERTGTHPV